MQFLFAKNGRKQRKWKSRSGTNGLLMSILLELIHDNIDFLAFSLKLLKK